MKNRVRVTAATIRRYVALLTLSSFLVLPAGLLWDRLPGGASALAAQAAQAKAPAQAASPAPAAVSPDLGWPRAYDTPAGAHLTLYQPQVASWRDQRVMTLYAAVSYVAKGATTPAIGTIKADADTKVALAERLVDFTEFSVTEANFPGMAREQVQGVVADLKAALPRQERVIALDRVLASLDKSQIIPKNVEGVKAEPPSIFFSTSTAVVVNVDGDPIWSPIAGNDLKYAVNTNWDLFEHASTRTFYLRNDASWLKASALAGPWGPAGALPSSFGRLPADDNWKAVKAALPGQSLTAKTAPHVFYSTTPAELIRLSGEPRYLLVPGTSLLWVSNTDSDVFRDGKTGPVYYLVAGRWFSAPDFKGPWTFATPTLPASFARIPLDHERSRVLASVPGTPQAAEAVLLASVPQTARVEKSVKAPEVVYQGGTPQFQPVEKTTVQRAVNTDKDILKVGDLFYMCFQGVWFMSSSATGPWEVTGTVPAQIYEIPPSSPSHAVTYVTVQESSSTSVVFASAAAYTGVTVAWGCAVWGTGYYYPPYVYYGAYPYYRPYYPTYGYSAWYNPWTGTYGRGAAVYGPYGGAGVGARYNPSTGTYARGAAAYGPYGARGAAEAYNPRTNTYGATRQGAGVYGSWGQTGVQRGDQWATTSRVTSNVTGATTRRTETSGGAEAISRRGGAAGNSFVGTSAGGDMYAGHDGNVYKKNGDSWQKYSEGGWNDVNRPTPQQRPEGSTRPAGSDSATAGQLNRDSAARAEGARRTSDASTVRSGATTARTGSYRAGASRGGGGRRR